MASVGRGELQAVAREAIETLSPAGRDVIVLHGIEQMSNNKVAEALKVQTSDLTVSREFYISRLAAVAGIRLACRAGERWGNSGLALG